MERIEQTGKASSGVATPVRAGGAPPGTSAGAPHAARAGKPPRGTLRHRDRRLAWIMISPAILVTCMVLVYPMFIAVQQSFYRIDTVTRQKTFVGLENYLSLQTDPEFWSSLWRTLYWVTGAMISQAVVGIIVAIALHASVKGRTQIRGAVLFPYLVPAIVAVLTWRWIFSDTVGVANYIVVDVLHLSSQPIPWFSPRWAMISVIVMSLWKYLPYWALFILARLQTIPTDLYEAAAIDGASAWQRFRHITWPWILPVVMVMLVLRSIWAFREFDMVYLPLSGGPLFHTTTIPVYIRHIAFDLLDVGRAAAVAMALLVVVAALTQFYFWIYDRSERQLD